MIDKLLAGKLIEKVSEFTEYNVNIMDENGIIIASKMKERIGSFHEVAFQVIKTGKDVIQVNNENPESGVKKGVNMAIYVHNTREGVVGITGEPHLVMPIAKIMKMSIEVMLEHEMYKYESMKKYNLKEQLMHLILYSDNFEKEDLTKYTTALRIDENMTRVPVLIEVSEGLEQVKQIVSLLEEGQYYSRQDIMDVTREGCFFIFKAIECDVKHTMQDYKYVIAEYLSPFLRYMRINNMNFKIYVGPLQKDIMYYHQAYLYCIWMQKNISKEGSHYFYDYIIKYLESMASMPELHAIFFMLKKELGQKFLDNYIDTMEVVIEKEYNLLKASQVLHVHKNTLVYRLDKIREILNMNPLIHNTDREFMECFYFYLKR